jgi:hypothetical protein
METPSSESGDRNAQLASLLQDGRELLEESEPVEAHSAFERWVSFVGRWLAPWHDQNGVGRRSRDYDRRFATG